eukprot:CAMPEP_0171161954 /NCGR_PEP_ID=MMETSP0790-20130122/4341_1 /TAXON_ID=2925 /ORGANISM="Alexandrium catenella, Strain OF101" /LENGTH=283 /DNA_ID=CAMNT_0011626539 /DNA_START=89 /DNA_END=937 /DNA_ORIENTATION=+
MAANAKALREVSHRPVALLDLVEGAGAVPSVVPVVAQDAEGAPDVNRQRVQRELLHCIMPVVKVLLNRWVEAQKPQDLQNSCSVQDQTLVDAAQQHSRGLLCTACACRTASIEYGLTQQCLAETIPASLIPRHPALTRRHVADLAAVLYDVLAAHADRVDDILFGDIPHNPALGGEDECVAEALPAGQEAQVRDDAPQQRAGEALLFDNLGVQVHVRRQGRVGQVAVHEGVTAEGHLRPEVLLQAQVNVLALQGGDFRLLVDVHDHQEPRGLLRPAVAPLRLP